MKGQSRDMRNIGHKTRNENKQSNRYNTENYKDEQHGKAKKTRGWDKKKGMFHIIFLSH